MCGVALPRRALVIISFYEPVLGLEFAVDAIKSLLAGTFEGHVPLVSRPAIVAPPVASSSPWTGHVHHLSINTALLTPGAHLRGPTLIGLHNRSQWRTKHPKPEALLIASCRLPIVDFASLARLRFICECESVYAESIGPMCIEHS